MQTPNGRGRPRPPWLVFEVARANLGNRLNVATRQIAGTQRW
ncbi:MAG: hypothetical protein ACREL5_08090 [Gemmatimonadales bacterium]